MLRSGGGRGQQYCESIVMFNKQVWEDLDFVVWCIIVLEVANRKWLFPTFKTFKVVIGAKWFKVCKENTPRIISSPISAKTSDTEQDESRFLWRLCQILIIVVELEAHQASRFFPRSWNFQILVKLCGFLFKFCVISWQNWHVAWASTAVAHQLWSLMRWCLLHAKLSTKSSCLLIVGAKIWPLNQSVLSFLGRGF